MQNKLKEIFNNPDIHFPSEAQNKRKEKIWLSLDINKNKSKNKWLYTLLSVLVILILSLVSIILWQKNKQIVEENKTLKNAFAQIKEDANILKTTQIAKPHIKKDLDEIITSNLGTKTKSEETIINQNKTPYNLEKKEVQNSITEEKINEISVITTPQLASAEIKYLENSIAKTSIARLDIQKEIKPKVFLPKAIIFDLDAEGQAENKRKPALINHQTDTDNMRFFIITKHLE
ncbi:MAG TPA: hypothetical protein PKD18_10970 [Saprospiraceae bacterium]|nr:hypothetical protein [Saprospiraceae bacterium]